MSLTSEKPAVGSNRMLTTAEAADYIGVARKTLQTRYHAWKIPYYQIGQRINFKQRDLDSWLAKHRVEPK